MESGETASATAGTIATEMSALNETDTQPQLTHVVYKRIKLALA